MARLDPTAVLNQRDTDAAALADLRAALAQPPATLLWMTAAATMTMLAFCGLILHGAHRAEASSTPPPPASAQQR
ncbi:MAG TPA: hypothetical protein VIA18_14355 [Polyangia bacterium]|nr:hypothetical protein [Polyangia bacterium]